MDKFTEEEYIVTMFELGFERMIMYLTGVSNIRDVEIFPRTVGGIQG